MKKLIMVIGVIHSLLGCSPKIHKHFEENKYVKDRKGGHILNDSLSLYFKGFHEINYTADRKKLKKIIRRASFKLKDSVLAHGYTEFSSDYYEFFITMSSKGKTDYSEELFVVDTLVNKQIIQFIGKKHKNYNDFLVNLSKNIKLNSNYNYQNILSIVQGINGENHYDNFKNRYLKSLKSVNNYPTSNKKEKKLQLKLGLICSSFLGGNKFYEKYLNEYETQFVIDSEVSKLIKKNVKKDLEVLEGIISKAKKKKIVMVNESNFYPNHKFLISDLLAGLKEVGYTTLALKTLEPKQDSVLNIKNKYPTLKTGFYTGEQNYNHLIRRAKDLGYQFLSYKNTNNLKKRVLGEVDNLHEIITSSNNKVLILNDMDDLFETKDEIDMEKLEVILKKQYKEELLTIDQINLNIYRDQIGSDYGMIKANLLNKQDLKSIDYLVINNKKRDINKKTSFSYKNKSKRDVQVSLFDSDEIVEKYDYQKKPAYFTTILESGKKCKLPANQNQKVNLYTFDNDGVLVDKILNILNLK